jgi:hypothetical protein
MTNGIYSSTNQTGTQVVGNKVEKGKEEALKLEEAVTNAMQATHGEDKGVLRYPLDLTEDKSNEVMRFNIKTRDSLAENKKTIYLYTPSAIASADSASYGTQNLGFIGGALIGGRNAMKPVMGEEGGGSLGDTVSAAVKGAGGYWELGKAGAIGLGQKFNTNLGDTALMGAGLAANPLTNMQFEGIGMRSFTFNFKLVAESRKEAIEIRSIENTFRKFLYPLQERSGVVLAYPPYWQIQFMKFGASAMEENKYLPFIDLCYLRNISCTYNASSNAFHLDGVPVELDMSLTFDEAQQNTRGDLYTDLIDFNSAEYTYERIGLPSLTVSED